jgi:hypothetical protein
MRAYASGSYVLPTYAGTPVAGPAGIEERARSFDIADVAGGAHGFALPPVRALRAPAASAADTAADDHAADRNRTGGVDEASQGHARRAVHERAARLGICQARKPKTSAAPTTSM